MTGNIAQRFRSRLSSILFSHDERRLRAGWRLSLQAMLQIVLTLGIGCAALLVPQTLLSGAFDVTSTWGMAAGVMAEVVTVTLSVWLARRLLDHRSFASLGLSLRAQAYRDLAAGIGIAMVIMGFIYVAEWRLGWLAVTGCAWNTQPAGYVIGSSAAFLGVFVLVGWSEEVMSRGYHLQTIASGLNLAWGLALSSAVFGVLHLANPHTTLMSAACIFLAGLLLGYAYVRTGQLWCSIGLHIGWNFFEGVVFGFPVSGLDTFHLVEARFSGPALWTGGPFGPEAGLILVPAILAGAALIHLYGGRYYKSETVSQRRPV